MDTAPFRNYPDEIRNTGLGILELRPRIALFPMGGGVPDDLDSPTKGLAATAQALAKGQHADAT